MSKPREQNKITIEFFKTTQILKLLLDDTNNINCNVPT